EPGGRRRVEAEGDEGGAGRAGAKRGHAGQGGAHQGHIARVAANGDLGTVGGDVDVLQPADRGGESDAAEQGAGGIDPVDHGVRGGGDVEVAVGVGGKAGVELRRAADGRGQGEGADEGQRLRVVDPDRPEGVHGVHQAVTADVDVLRVEVGSEADGGA